MTFPGLNTSSFLSPVRDLLARRSIDAYLVGGYLRERLRGVPTRDIDLAVAADPLALARELARLLRGSFVPLGEAHQVARVVLPPVKAQGSEGWRIDLAAIQGTMQEDLGRRDFTVDAMALPLEAWDAPDWEGRVLDPFRGQDDLAQGLIRAVKDPVFRDDPLRLLRALRLAARLGFAIEPHTQELIVRDASHIHAVAPERLREELLAILSLEGAQRHLETLDRLGLLGQVIPELETTKGVSQPREHHWDVFQHSLETAAAVERVTAGASSDPLLGSVPWCQEKEAYFAQEASDGHSRRTLLKLAALLHDIAKPQTRVTEPRGRIRFLGHHTLGASMAQEVLQRLRFSTRGVRMVCGMVEHHLRPTQMSQGMELPTPRAVYRYFRDLGDIAIDTLYLSLADYLAARGPSLDVEDWQGHVRIIRHILETGLKGVLPWKDQGMPRLVNGHDLMAAFGLPPGPRLGALLEAVREAQVAGEVSSREEALAWLRRHLKETGEDRAPKNR